MDALKVSRIVPPLNSAIVPFHMSHSCFSFPPGLPCLPSAARLSIEGAADRIIHNATKVDTFNVGSVAFLTFGVYVLLLALLVSVTCNCRMSRRLQRQQGDTSASQRESRRPRGRVRAQPVGEPGPFGDLEHEGFAEEKGDLSQPLLSDKNGEEGPKEEETEEGEKEAARVEFV